MCEPDLRCHGEESPTVEPEAGGGTVLGRGEIKVAII